MVVWNDLVAMKGPGIRQGVQISNGEGIRDLLVSYRSGDMWAPQIEQTEALRVELSYFADCIMNDETPFKRRTGRPARGSHVRGGRVLHSQEGRVGATVNDSSPLRQT